MESKAGVEMDIFANTMKLIRTKSGLSIQQLAEKAGISRSMVYKIENQDTQPSLDVAIRISRALNTDLSAMLNESESKDEYIIKYNDQPTWEDEKTGIIRRSLLPNDRKYELLRVTLPAHARTNSIPGLGNREGFLYLLTGKLTIELSNNKAIKLSKGDIFIIPNDHEHSLNNTTHNNCDLIVLITKVNHPHYIP